MKNRSDKPSGKILNHDQATGITDERDIEQRASEIASIEDHEEVQETDLQQAERELNGEDIAPPIDSDGESRGGLSRDPSEPPSNFGRQIPDQEAEEEQFAAERLVAEGVNEAEHEQMLAARRRKQV
ncbi:MAG: hypothetical protein JWM88_259 [Verrucomicrobia bacterium]|nr:hypothetical protein [Verrucomicrobiota bacterium]